MGDYFAPFEGGPLPPEEPDIPPPFIEDLAASLGVGLDKSGTFGKLLSLWVDACLAAAMKVLGGVLNILAAGFAFLIALVGKATEDGKFGIDLLITSTVSELFGVKVANADVSGRKNTSGRDTASFSIAKAIVGALFKGVQVIEGGGVVPSTTGADAYLAAVMRMEVNGWIEGWFTDGLSAHFLEKYGELKDGIARSLGLGRLSRQALRAPMKILVSDPYTAALNYIYRPRHWDEKALMARYNRGQVSRDELSRPLGNQGYTEAQIDELVRESQKNLSLAELDYLDQRGLADAVQIRDRIVELGYPEGTAATVLQIMRDKRVQRYREEMVKVGEAAYVAGNIGPDTFAAIVDQSGVTDEEKDWIQQIATLKVQVKNRHLTLGEIETGIQDGILNFNDLKAWALREGMSAHDEAILELEEQFKLNKQSALQKAKAATSAAKVATANAKLQAAQQKAAAAKAQAADAGLKESQAAQLVKEGIWTIEQFAAFLTTHGYGPDAVAASVALLKAQIHAAEVKTTAAHPTRTTAVAKGLNLAQMERAFIEGIVTEDQLTSYLLKEHYSPEDAQVIVDLAHDALTAAQVKKDTAAAARAHAATKSISLPDLERAVRLGLTSVDTYVAALQHAKFDDASVALLKGVLQSQIASDKATAAKSAAAAATPTSKGITVAQLEQEVVARIRPIADYTAALQALKYSFDDQRGLTALLQLKVDQAKSTAAKSAAAAKALAPRGISLADAERAVKLGIVPIDTYTQLLQSLHYTPDAIDVLRNTLLAQVAAARKAQTSANAAGKLLATKSISLVDLEKAVIAGLQPITAYTAALIGAHYSGADAALLTALLQLKVDQAARAAVVHADAEGKATQRGIALGKVEAAVVGGITSMDDYDALLVALGYDEVDRAVMEQLLQVKVDAAATKAAKDLPPEPPGAGTAG